MEDYYKAEYSASIEEVYSSALEKSIEFMFRKLMDKYLIFDELILFWSNLWNTTALRLDIDEEKAREYEVEGMLVLLEIFDKVDSRLTVVAVNVPWVSEWEAVDAEIRGKATAVLYGSFVEDQDYASDFYVVETIPTHAPFRGNATAMSTYHLSCSAVSGSARFTYRQRGFGLLLIDLKTGVISFKEPINYMTTAPIIKNCVLQMVHLAGIPDTASHCRSCPYRNACQTSLWTRRSMRSRKKTKKQIESEL